MKPKTPKLQLGAAVNAADLTPVELSAVAELQELAKRWPKGLWLYSGSGTLWVMQSPGGEAKHHENGISVDPAFTVASINIPNDGGDW